MLCTLSTALYNAVDRVAEKQDQTIEKTAAGKLTSGCVAGGLIVRLLGRELQTGDGRIRLATRSWREVKSNIRHNDFRLLFVLCSSRSGTPPWILKLGGLESSSGIIISSIGKTKIIAFFPAKKNLKFFWIS